MLAAIRELRALFHSMTPRERAVWLQENNRG